MKTKPRHQRIAKSTAKYLLAWIEAELDASAERYGKGQYPMTKAEIESLTLAGVQGMLQGNAERPSRGKGDSTG